MKKFKVFYWSEFGLAYETIKAETKRDARSKFSKRNKGKTIQSVMAE